MADFFFFTDTDLLNLQTTGNFGPESNTIFRLNSTHSSSSDCNAYAICNGVIFVQEDAENSNLLNIVLKPLEQPSDFGQSIAYYIYRGIKKNSLLNLTQDTIASQETNDLTFSIWESQINRNKNKDIFLGNEEGTTTDFPNKNLLGLNYVELGTAPYILLDTDEITKVFFNSSSEFQLSKVNGGWTIGKFDSTEFSFEIVLESSLSTLTAGVIRSKDHALSVSELPEEPTMAEIFDDTHQKEEILSYVDLCSFIGSFYNVGLKTKNSTDTGFSTLNSDSLYENVISKFVNRNRVYLDVRNEFNYSINKFGNYGTELKISFDSGATPSSFDYYRSNWPIFVIDSDFTTPLDDDYFELKIAFPKGDNLFPLLYARNAISSKSSPNNLKGENQFLEVFQDGVEDFSSNDFSFRLFNYNTENLPVCSLIRLDYLRCSYYSKDINVNYPLSSNAFDNLFLPLKMISYWSNEEDSSPLQMFSEEQFVNAYGLNGLTYMAKKGVIQEPDGRLTYFAISVNTYDGGSVEYDSIYCNSQPNIGMGSVGFLCSISESSYVAIPIVVDNDEVLLENLRENFGADRQNKRMKNSNELLHLSFSEEEFIEITDIINDTDNAFIQNYGIYLGAELEEEGYDDNGDFPYQSFTISVNGYKLDNSTNSIVFQKIDTQSKIFRLIK